VKIVYIHGATASHNSFAYIEQNITEYEYFHIDYPKELPAEENLKNITSAIKKNINEPFFIVSHSLGGIYSLYLLEQFKKKVVGVVSLATPFGGSESAILGKISFPSYQVFRDVTSFSPFIRNSLQIPVTVPWLQVVTTLGEVPWMLSPNDGVVTRKSMMSRTDVEYIDIESNHYEIVLSNRTVNIIKNRINQIQPKS
jgi:pimeloyl-ACP methyl ester carboxylesterase